MNVFAAVTMTESTDASPAVEESPTTSMGDRTITPQDPEIVRGDDLAGAFDAAYAAVGAKAPRTEPCLRTWLRLAMESAQMRSIIMIRSSPTMPACSWTTAICSNRSAAEAPRSPAPIAASLGQADGGSIGIVAGTVDAAPITAKKARRDAGLDRVFAELGKRTRSIRQMHGLA